MTTFLLAIVLQAQAPTIDDRIAKFVQGDAAAREALVKLGAAAIQPLQGARDKAPEKIDDLVFEIKKAVAHPKETKAPASLEAKKSIEIKGAEFRHAVAHLQESFGVALACDQFDPADLKSQEVSVVASDTPLRAALDLMCRQAGLDYGFFHNVVVIGKPERLWPGGESAPAFGPSAAERQDVKTPDGIAVMRQLRTIKMDLDFQNQSINDMVGYLKEFTGLDIVVGGDADASRFSVRLKGSLLLDALSLITQVRDLDFMIVAPGLMIDRRETISKKLGK